MKNFDIETLTIEELTEVDGGATQGTIDKDIFLPGVDEDHTQPIWVIIG